MIEDSPTVEKVIKYLGNLNFGTYVIDDFVAKVNQAAWVEIVIDYCQTHPEVYFTSDMKKIKKIDIGDFMKADKPKNKAA